LSSSNLFLVSSPFQILCSIEAIHYFDLKYNNNELIIVNRGVESNYRQMVEVYKKNQNLFRNFELGLDQHGSILKWKKRFKHLTNYVSNFEIKYLFIGDYREGISRHISNTNIFKQLFLLDDGFATLELDEKIYNRNIHNWKDYIRFIAESGDYKFGASPDITFFSIFKNLKNKCIYNSFNYLNAINKTKLITSEIYLLGSPVVEDGLLDLSIYLNHLKNYLNNNKEYPIKYFPHRREKNNKIKHLLSLDKNLILQENSIPIEQFIINNKTQPFKVASLFSTALYTIRMLNKGIDIDIIKIPINKFNIDNKRIKNIYDLLTELIECE